MTAPRSTRLADVRERPLDHLTPTPLQCLALRTLHPSAIVPDGLLLGLRLVRHLEPVLSLRFRDISPYVKAVAQFDGRRGMIALVRRRFLDRRVAARRVQVIWAAATLSTKVAASP